MESIRDPQESATKLMSTAPPREALWTALALVAVLSTLLSQVGFMISGGTEAAMGVLDSGPLIMAGIGAFFIVLTVFLVFWVGRICGGTGSFEETLLLIVWLQVIFVAVQIAQMFLAILAPFLTLMVVVASVGLFFYLLTHFIVALHGFRSAGLVFVGIVISAFCVLFVVGLVMAMLGIAPGATGAPV